jgi:hypothetical protein
MRKRKSNGEKAGFAAGFEDVDGVERKDKDDVDEHDWASIGACRVGVCRVDITQNNTSPRKSTVEINIAAKYNKRSFTMQQALNHVSIRICI